MNRNEIIELWKKLEAINEMIGGYYIAITDIREEGVYYTTESDYNTMNFFSWEDIEKPMSWYEEEKQKAEAERQRLFEEYQARKDKDDYERLKAKFESS